MLNTNEILNNYFTKKESRSEVIEQLKNNFEEQINFYVTNKEVSLLYIQVLTSIIDNIIDEMNETK